MSVQARPCDRCGTFAPLRSHWGRQICAECFERRHPVQTEPMAVDALIAGSLRVIGELGFAVLAWTGAFALAEVLVSVVTEHMFGDTWQQVVLSTVIGTFTTDLLGAAVTVVAVERIEHQRAMAWRTAWMRVARRLPSVLTIQLLLVVAMIAGLSFCCVPSFVIATFWLLALPIALREGRGPIAALARSGRRIRPVFWTAFAAYVALSVVPLGLAIGSSMVALQTELPGSAVLTRILEAATYATWLPAMVLPSVAYAKLPGRH